VIVDRSLVNRQREWFRSLHKVCRRGLSVGMTRLEMLAKQGTVAELSDLGDHLELPLRSNSGAMHVRLAFAMWLRGNLARTVTVQDVPGFNGL
jgi:hypothetical protein